MNSLPLGVIEERRSSRRHRVDVRCQAVAEYDFFLLGDQVSDLSSGGLLLRSEGAPAELGESVLLSFRPPGSDQWIDAEAKVVRLVTGTQPGAPGIGLELGDLPAFESGLLSASLELSERERPRPRPVISVRRRNLSGKVPEREMRAVGVQVPRTVNGIARVMVIQ